jgi:hypothetical protein
VPIIVQPIGADLTGRLGAALVRPDGVVAWRADKADVAELDWVMAGLRAVGGGVR